MAQVVVCSRIADYEVLTKKLRLQGAVLLHTLTDQQIEDALQQLGERAERVRTVLQNLRENARRYEDPEAEELTRTPLLLSITTLAYQGKSDEELPPPDAPPADQQRHLFTIYTDRMFKRRGQNKKYTPEQTKHWLSWLAERLYEDNQTIFQLELMQPCWLTTRAQTYEWLAVWILTCISIVNLLFGGLILGFIFELLIWMSPEVLGDTDFNVLTQPGDGLFIGLVIGVICAALLMKVFSRALFRMVRHIELIEVVHWSWRGALNGLGFGLIIGFVVELLVGLGSWWGRESYSHLGFFLLGGVILGLLVGLHSGLKPGKLNHKTIPNEGIRRSLRSAVFTGLFLGPSTGLVAGFGIVMLIGLFGDIDRILIGGLLAGAGAGLFFGIGFGVISHGGASFINHWVLRSVLALSNQAPLNYARFLNYATERILLRRVGGSYIFVHRMLLEYFANLEQEKTQT
jgi:hypothetical protein